MNKLLLILFLFLGFSIQAQSTQDTIDKPIWQSMMFNKNINIEKTRRAFDLYFSNKEKVKGTGFKQFERWYAHWRPKCDEYGNFPAPDHTMKEYKKFLRNNLTARSANGNFTNIGPLTQAGSSTGIPIGTGRVQAIAFHPTNPNLVYAGAAQGGFWYSTNKGANWIGTTDAASTLGVADIVFIKNSPTDSVILLGTGDRDANDANGMGVFKSTDGGITFSVSNTGMGNQSVCKLVANKLKPTTLYAATDNGIYVSYNQGATWTIRAPTTGVRFTDIVYCPNDTMFIYATAANAFYRSTNGGSTWTSLGAGAGGFSATAKNRMQVCVSEFGPNVVYVVASASSDLEGVYKSSDWGASFTKKASTPNMLSGQGWYNIDIESSNTDSNIVYVGGLNVYKSTNGATSFSQITDWTGASFDWVHADCHFLGRSPINNELWIGSDGAIDYTNDEGNSFNHRDNGLSISQIYNLGVSQKSKSRVICGLQDNGSLVTSSSSGWMARVGGDGMHCEISNFDTMKMLANVQYGDLRKSTNGGASWTDISSTIPGAGSSTTSPWSPPVHLHPRINDLLVMIIRNAAVMFNTFSAATPSSSAITTGITAGGSALRFSNKNDSFVFMGWDNGTFKYCNVLDGSYPLFNGANPSGTSSITDIETSYVNENIVYCTSGNNVYRSSNKGVNWNDISSNLPNITMFSIVADKNSPEGLYVGTDAGIYYKDSLMSNWILYNTNMPAASEVRDLEIVYDTVCSDRSVLYAATFGRGLWKGDLRVSETQPQPDFTISPTACSGVDVPITNTTTIGSNGATVSYQWTITPATYTFAGGTTSTDQNPIINFTAPGTYSIKLKASKPFGGFCTIDKPNIIIVGTSGTMNLKTVDKDTICPGDTVLIQVGGLKNYTFAPNTEITQFQDSNAYAFPTTNTKYLIIGSINGGCFDSAYVEITMKPFPAHTMTGQTVLCSGDSTTLTFSGVDTAYFNPMTNVTDISVLSKKIVPSSNQTYLVRLVKPGLCDVKLVLPIKVRPIPVFNLNKTGNQILCLGDSLFIRDLASIPNKIFTPVTGITVLNKDSFWFKPTVNTKYYLNSGDTGYCNTTKDSISFNVFTSPTITVSGPGAVCGGATIMLIASGASTYAWSPSTYLNSISKDTVLCTPTASVVYTITGSVGTCSGTATKTVNVGTGSISLKYTGKLDVCQGNTTKISASGAATYKWVPGNLVSNEFGDTVKVTTPNSVVLKLYGESVGCKDSISIPITVRPIPSVSYSLSNTNPICEGEKLTVKISGANSYSISPTYNVKTLKFDSFELSPKSTTKYHFFGSNQFNCSHKDSAEVIVNPLPKVSISPTFSTINRGDAIALTALGGSSYEWTPNKWITTSNMLSTIQSKPDSNIVYSVKVTSSAGCISNGISIIYVLQNATSVGINDTDIQNILVYPNPSSEVLNIESTEKVLPYIYDMKGSLVKKFSDLDTKHILNITDISTGNYLLILENKSGDKKVVKIDISK